ncbi:hypothetical protein [Thermodesulfatator atlanticus]|uniref:hypothetical protein n=1 Tax=Thermodesulfatator atlanticus TaxID=501497 RepID=UPI0003B784B6|nr:hypothetical protein [Thermodesulfatator atlanticus]
MARKVTPEEMYRFVSEALTFSAEELILLLPEYREGLKNSPKTRDVDRMVFENIKNLPEIWEDDDTYPLEKWWWHLRKIAHREYPAELLPAYLREIYLASGE